MAGSARIRVWDGPTRLFHWLLVGLLGFSWWSAGTDHMDWHLLSGLTLCGLLLFRLIWGFAGGSTARFASFLRGPGAVWRYVRTGKENGIGHNPLGALSVIALLLAVAVQLLSGLFAVDVDGIESGPLSYLVDFDRGRAAAQIHHAAFTVLQGLVVLHIAAILFYLLFRRRDLIGPMVIGSRAADDAETESLKPAPLWRLAAAAVIAGTSAYALSRGLQF